MRHLIIIALAIFISTSVFANLGQEGNGGDVVTCNDSIEILDFYEARIFRNIKHDLGEENLTVEEKIQIALNRIKRLSPMRAEEYRKKAQAFYSEANFLDNITLSDIPDSDHIFLPDGCKIEQIIIHREPTLPNDKRYIVDNDLWKQLDNNNKAALILHEIIYREALDYSHNNSISTRVLNSYATSSLLENIPLGKFITMLKEVNFLQTDVQGVEIDLSTKVEYYPESGEIKEAIALAGKVGLLHDKINVLKECPITFYKTGEIKSLTASESKVKFMINGKPYTFLSGENFDERCGYKIGLYENKKILFGTLASRQIFNSPNYKLYVHGGTGDFGNDRITHFHSNGKIKNATLYKVSRINAGDYGWLEVSPRSLFGLYYNSVLTYSDGSMMGGQLTSTTSFKVRDRSVNFHKWIYLYHSGPVSQGILSRTTKLEKRDGTRTKVKRNKSVRFDKDGFLVE